MAPTPPTHVLACASFDGQGACIETAWVPHNALGVPLPTLDQGAAIGGAILLSVSLVVALRILNPPKEID